MNESVGAAQCATAGGGRFFMSRVFQSEFFPSAKSFLHQLKFVVSLRSQNAQVAELVDALVSGTSVRKDVQVRALSRAQKDEVFRLFFGETS